MVSVQVIVEGWLRREDGVLREAHSTATLIATDQHHILVDTSTPRHRDALLHGLRSLGLGPEDIDMVVSTHLHMDHVGNDSLFTRAVRMARAEERPGPGHRAITADVDIAPHVRLLHTPGHTPGSMSVVVEADDRVHVIAGDAVPTRDNIEKWAPPGIHYDREVALDSMHRIVDLADVVVPGHGGAFELLGLDMKKR